MTTELVQAVLNMALQRRRPRDVVDHSDQGSECTTVPFGQRCQKMGVRPSMGSAGDAYDKAMAESSFATLECELIDRRSSQTKTEARLVLFTYFEDWYDPRRRFSALGYQSPEKFEPGRGETVSGQRLTPLWTNSTRRDASAACSMIGSYAHEISVRGTGLCSEWSWSL